MQSVEVQQLTDENEMLEDNKNSAFYIERKRILVEDEHETFSHQMKEQPCHVNQLTEHDKLKKN